MNYEVHHRLRSTTSSSLIVRHTRLSTVGDRGISGCCRSYLEESASSRH